MAATLFENEQWSISLDHVTWVEKKRDGAVSIHFPGSDVILMNKTYGPAFLEAYQKYHVWHSQQNQAKSAQQAAPAQQPRPAQPPANPTA
jgi:hypothetical protein